MKRAITILSFLLLPLAAMAETVLYMAEEDGCMWCERWNQELGHIYPKTAEGRTAPLKRFDLHRDSPDVAFEKSIHFTPTFILVQNGQEVGRIEGYPGEDFFWGLLGMVFERAEISLEDKES